MISGICPAKGFAKPFDKDSGDAFPDRDALDFAESFDKDSGHAVDDKDARPQDIEFGHLYLFCKRRSNPIQLATNSGHLHDLFNLVL